MNPYQILGLQQNSSIDDVERAYKKLAFQFHPDRNPGDAESEKKFREIQDAYDRIKNQKIFNQKISKQADLTLLLILYFHFSMKIQMLQ